MDKKMKVAVIGVGRMGSFVAEQLPDDVEKIIIDANEATAKTIADVCGATYSTSPSGAAGADIVAVVLPFEVIPLVIDELSGALNEGAIILNMATGSKFDEALKEKYPHVTFVEAKIMGSADSIRENAPNYVVVGTEDESIYQKVSHILPGYTKVVMGDSSLVPIINVISANVGIRAAIELRKELQPYNIPDDWVDLQIFTVCAGAMRTYVQKNLGHFGVLLAEKLEKEMLGK